MIKKKMKAIVNGSFMVALMIPTIASAQWAVIDGTNLIQNTSTAVAAVKTEVSTAATYIAQLKANIELVRSTLSMEGLAKLTGMEAELATARDLMKANDELTGTLKQGQNLYSDVQAQFGASNFSWSNFLQNTARNDLSRATWMMDRFTSINKSLESAASRRQDIVNKLQDSQGATQATQAVGAAVDVVIGQNQQVISILNTQLGNAAAEKQQQIEADQFNNEQYQNRQDGMRDAAAKYR